MEQDKEQQVNQAQTRRQLLKALTIGGGAAALALTGLPETQAVEAQEQAGTTWNLTGNPNTNPTNNFLGTTDYQPLALRTNGTERMRIAANGYIGIANIAPDHTLVVGPPGGGRHLVINDIRTARWGFATGGYALSIQNDGDNGNWKSRFVISKEGNVGIGTTGPRRLLTVRGAPDTTGGLVGAPGVLAVAVTGTPRNGSVLGRLEFGTNDIGGYAQYPARIVGISEADAYTANGKNHLITGQLQFQTLANAPALGDDEATPTTRMTILGNGNVGIGTTGPRRLLTVRGAPDTTGGLVGAPGVLAVAVTGTPRNGSVLGRLEFGTNDIGGYAQYPARIVGISEADAYTANGKNHLITGQLQFQTLANAPALGDDEATPTTRMTILGNGNVGIGTTTPDHTLVVGPAGGGRHLVINDSRTARWGFATGGYALSIQNDGDNGNWMTRVLISKEGNVGIGTTSPQVKLEVAGDIRANDVILTSDARLKTNVSQLTDTLEKLKQIRGVTYTWSEVDELTAHARKGPRIGVLAQEVEAVFPELVFSPSSEGYKGVNYNGLIGVLVEASKELIEQNKRLMEQHEVLRQRVEVLESPTAS